MIKRKLKKGSIGVALAAMIMTQGTFASENVIDFSIEEECVSEYNENLNNASLDDLSEIENSETDYAFEEAIVLNAAQSQETVYWEGFASKVELNSFMSSQVRNRFYSSGFGTSEVEVGETFYAYHLFSSANVSNIQLTITNQNGVQLANKYFQKLNSYCPGCIESLSINDPGEYTFKWTFNIYNRTYTSSYTISVYQYWIELDKSSMNLKAGETGRINLSHNRTNGSVSSSVSNNPAGINWYTDSSVISVDAFGNVTAKSAGTGTVYAEYAGGKVSCTVNVAAVPETVPTTQGTTTNQAASTQTTSTKTTTPQKTSVEKTTTRKTTVATNTPVTTSSVKKTLKLNKTKATLKKGKRTQLKVVNNTGGKVTFRSSNKKVASVSKTGKIKAKKKGKATIYVTANGITRKCVVTVK